jgi:hypothetical protein
MASKPPDAMAKYIANPMLVSKSQVEECIFCLDTSPPPLKKNDKCDCQYVYHSTCQESWNSQQRAEGKRASCVMCRKEEPHVYIVIELPIQRAKVSCKQKICYIFGIFIVILLLLVGYRLFF